MPFLPGKFVWFEHLSPDPDAAAGFYERLLGWRNEGQPLGGQPRMILNGTQRIGSFRGAPAGQAGHWLPYLSVPDVDAAHAAALAAGARCGLAPTDVASFGRSATITDPTGATLALCKSTAGDRPDVAPVPLGDWYWTELSTPDENAALVFYETVFGFTHDTMDMGAQGSFHLLLMAGTVRAGLGQAPEGLPPMGLPMWLPYVRVADADAAAVRAESLGARLAMPPTDVPDGGRFTMLVDPFGAAIALMRAKPGT